jgi:polyisoprenoid-binding protein YceI
MSRHSHLLPAALLAGVLAGVFSMGSALAEPLALPVDAGRSQVTFSARQMNIPAEGKFNKFSAAINWDAAKPETSHAEINVDLNSGDMGLDDVNSELKGKEWFDSKTFPQAKFVSATVKVLGGGKFEAAGKLSIKGRTHDITAPFTVKPEGAGSVFEGVFPIKRLQYGVGEGSWSDTAAVADEVQIKFRIVTGAAPGAGQRKK